MAQTKTDTAHHASTQKTAAKRSSTGGRRKTAAQSAGGVDERGRLIAEAAYYKAAERDFAPGMEMEDWLAAEREVGTGHQAS